MSDKVLLIILILVSAFLLTLVSGKIFQIFQLSSYRVKGVFNWMKLTKFDYPIRYFALAFLSFIGMLVFVGCFNRYEYVKYLGILFEMGLSVVFVVILKKEKSKVPLKITARMMRFIAVSALYYLGFSFLVSYIGTFFSVSYALLGLLPMFVPILVTAAHYTVLPFETLNNYSYKVRAVKKLDALPQILKIGITGSYGKTTTKVVLAKMLGKKYKVCYSKASYNTPMGICKVVNNDLMPDDQVFIAEMGARYVGDIQELAEIVRPNYGIITAIGNQHLETFGSVENIKNTKYELIENLAPNGLALFNGDNDINVQLYAQTKGSKILTGKAVLENAFATYKDVVQTDNGTEFTVNAGNNDYALSTMLLGSHIPSIVTLCFALALELGVPAADLVEAVRELEPVPHRLEMMKQGNMIIIDDAYNANVEGAESALKTLALFNKTKVIITPGLVELGKEEKQANLDLGAKIGKVCDYALFVGLRAKELREGALSAGMNEEKVKSFADINSAVEFLRTIGGEIAVLFENDLPDNY